MSSQEKVHENRLRRMARRQGLVLNKSRARDPRHRDFGDYVLVDAHTNTFVAGCWDGQGLTLEEVEDALNE
jgi:hypothetical protein